MAPKHYLLISLLAAGCGVAEPPSANRASRRGGTASGPGGGGGAAIPGEGETATNTSDATSALPVDTFFADKPLQLMPRRVVLQTPQQLAASVKSLTGLDTELARVLPSQPAEEGFRNAANALAGRAFLDAYAPEIEKISGPFVTAATKSLACADNLADLACTDAWLLEFAGKAYRRAPTAEEKALLARVHAAMLPNLPPAMALQAVVEMVLQSPQFLYRMEDGTPDANRILLSQAELATQLAFLLWSAPPDAELAAAAAGGRLATKDDLVAQATRMMADARFQDGFVEFFVQWLGVAELETIQKDAATFPEFTPELRAAMQSEIAEFAKLVLAEPTASFTSLVSGTATKVTSPMKAFYKITPDVGNAAAPFTMPTAERGGILTLPGVIAAHSDAKAPTPMRRGLFILKRFLCQNMPPPPANVQLAPAEPGTAPKTLREAFLVHSANPQCIGCHKTLDSLAFVLGHYDALGKYFAKEGSAEVDASGALDLTFTKRQVKDAVELGAVLATSPEAQQCFVRNLFRYSFGRVEKEGDYAVLRQAMPASEGGALSIKNALLAFVGSDLFRYREK